MSWTPRTKRCAFLIDNLDLPTATGYPAAVWEGFQIRHLEDDSTFRAEVKSRQIAWSWLSAAEAVAVGLLNRESSVFISINLDEAKEKIRYVHNVIDGLPRSMRPRLVTNNRTELEFDNGARLMSLPAIPPRGKAQMNVYLDEFAHVREDNVIYTAALPMITKGNRRLRMASSPMGASGRFWEVFKESLRKYPGYTRKSTPWWEVQAFCLDVREARKQGGVLTTEQMVEQYGNERVKAIYANMPIEDFMQEYCCHLASTEVMLANGLTKRFIDLDIGDQLVYNNGCQVSPCTVEEFRRIGMRSIIEITMETGATFAASTGHKMKGRQGKEPIDTIEEVSYVFAPHRVDGEQEALARLVGMNLGDGTIAQRAGRYKKKSGEVSLYPYFQASFYSQKQEDLEDVASDFVMAGLAETKPNVLFKKGSRLEYDAFQLHVSQKAAQRLVDAGCVVGKKIATDFAIPDWILNGGPTVKREFLAALFGAEGSTPRDKNQKQKNKLPQTLYLRMFKTEPMPRFFEQVQGMLQEFGVQSTLTSRQLDGRVSYSIMVHSTAENALVFWRNVGYRYARRKEEMAFLWSHYLQAYQHERVMRKQEATALRAGGLTYKAMADHLGISAQGAYNLTNKPIMRSSWDFPQFGEWVGTRYQDGTLYIRVTDRRVIGEDEVFNIRVDSPDHSYLLADGLDNYNCLFVDETTAWITWEEIKEAQALVPDLACYLAKATGTLTPEIHEAIEHLRRGIAVSRTEQAYTVGVDIGRTRNTTEIYAIGLTTTDTYPLRLALSLDNVTFDDQLSVIVEVLDRLPVVSMMIDETGIGRNLAENAEKYHPAKVQGVTFTGPLKALWATNAKMLIQGHKTPLPVDKDMAYQFHSIKKLVTASRNLAFDTATNEKHHADKFWAWALALAGAHDGQGGGGFVLRYA